jgi:hypothetical protein
MNQGKGRKKQSIPKKKSINKKAERAVICLDPEKLKYPERVNAAKLKIVKDAAATGDLKKLEELSRFDEDKIITPWEDAESVSYEKAEAFRDGIDIGITEGRIEGFKIAKDARKAHHQTRTNSATETIKKIHDKKAGGVVNAYIKLMRDPVEKACLLVMSESRMAQRVKEVAESNLKTAVVNNNPVLKREIDRNGNVIYKGLSITTVIRILRNEAGKKLLSYHWGKKQVSQT